MMSKTGKDKMEIDEAIKGRRAIRKYKQIDIPDSVIEELLDLARYAPSSMNGQPWHFIVVRGDKTKKRIIEIKNKYCPPEKQSYKADFMKCAPVIIVVCVDKQKSYGREIENGVLATVNIILGAYSRGLGSVYLSAYRTDEPRISEEIRQILGIPENVDPITIIPLGYPDEILEPKKLRIIEEMIHYERF
ncbi:MAG: nitroreductase family protein [Candidatus Dadabacteria bacterium]